MGQELPLDLRGLSWQAARGWHAPITGNDQSGEIDSLNGPNFTASGDWKTVTTFPIIVNKLFNIPADGKTNFFSLKTKLRLAPDTREKHLAGLGLYLQGIGEGWRVYWNGTLLEDKLALTTENPPRLRFRQYGRGQAIMVPRELLSEENEILIHLAAHAPVVFFNPNGHAGLTFSQGYFLDTAAGARERSLEGSKTVFSSVYLFFGLYHLFFYLRRRKIRYNLWFGLFSISIAVFLLALSNQSFRFFENDNLAFRLGYFVQPVALVTVVLFLREYFLPPPWNTGNILRGLYGGNLLLAVLMFLVPATWLLPLLQVWYLAALPLIGYIVWFIVRGVVRGWRDMRRMALAWGISLVFLVWDILDSVFFHTRIQLMAYGHLLIVLSIIALLAHRFLENQIQTERLNQDLKSQAASYSRFVPGRFLELLDRQDIRQVGLGDNSEKQMSVLVSDIRSFTTLSETMTPDENFRFLNTYLGRLSPIIRREGGFIDKFIGDSIMALFDGPADNAVRAAVEITAVLRDYNEFRKKKMMFPVATGLGVHSGNLILGIIGEEERLESTVVSDAVNMAFRLEQLTKKFATNIIISENTFEAMDPENQRALHTRYLGRVRVRGKRSRVGIYEVLDGLNDEQKKIRLGHRDQFEKAVRALQSGNKEEAMDQFLEIGQQGARDQAVQIYLAELKGVIR